MINTDILMALLELVAGFVLLYFGGNWLVDGGVVLARRFRISPLVVGMTVVAFGTSAPELLVSMTSAIKGNAGIAMGNVIGSNIANIGLILGVTAMICPITTDNRKVTANGIVMIISSLLLLVLGLNNGISRLEGLLLTAGIVLFTTISIIKGRTKAIDNRVETECTPEQNTRKPMPAWVALLLVILSCGMLSFGADSLVNGSTTIARAIGVSDKVIGLTIVALGTSLPELAASIAAALKKEMDISIGNIIGSNIFNILCVLGLSATIYPIAFEFTLYSVDFAVMIAFSLTLVLLIRPWRPKGVLGRIPGFIMFVCYALYTYRLFC